MSPSFQVNPNRLTPPTPPVSPPNVKKESPSSAPSLPPQAIETKDSIPTWVLRGKSSTNQALFGSDVAPISKIVDIDTKGAFFNVNAVSEEEIDAILKHYGSPHAGKGAEILSISQEEGINPLMMLAVMQQESSYGNTSNNGSLKPENVANPWSVHFNEGAKGIKKLRLKDGSMPSFSQSYRAAARTMINLAGESSTPLTQAGKKYSTTASWTNSIKSHYATQLNRVKKMRP